MFHVSDSIVLGLFSTYNATIWNTKPLGLSVWLESLVLATIVSYPQNSASYLAALPSLETQNDYYATTKRPQPVELYEGRLALTLLETEDYCEMTKQVILWSVIAFPVYVIA